MQEYSCIDQICRFQWSRDMLTCTHLEMSEFVAPQLAAIIQLPNYQDIHNNTLNLPAEANSAGLAGMNSQKSR